MLKAGVIFQQTLNHLVALLVVHECFEVAHHDLDAVVDHVDREVLHADVQHSAPLHVFRQGHHVLFDHLQHSRVVRLHVLGVG